MFDDDENDALETKKASQQKNPSTKPEKATLNAKKPVLFNDEDGEEDIEDYKNDFQIKEQFQGRKGEKLMKLQSRFQTDSRFKMDAKFMDDDDEYYSENEIESRNRNSQENENGDDDERQWQYNILESVIGKKVRQDAPRETKKKYFKMVLSVFIQFINDFLIYFYFLFRAPPSMLRFDPTRAEHTKFVEPKGKKRANNKNNDEPSSKRAKIPDEDDEKVDEVPVDMDQFYKVRDDFQKSLGSTGFSLLNMFNRSSGVEENKQLASAVPYKEQVIPTKAKFLSDLDPFKYDSSGDEADDNKKKITSNVVVGNSKESEIQHETFFILSSSDARLSGELIIMNCCFI